MPSGPNGADPLAGLHVKALLADGESQSAFRMLSYANAVQPVANVYNGILIHSRPGVAGGINDTSPLVPAARVRTDLTVPVFQFETETDMFDLAGPGPFSFPAARQPDTSMIRTWEVAGTAHADSYLLQYVYAEGIKQYGVSGFIDLRPAFAIVNNGPEHFVANAALRSLRNWAVNGTPPPSGAPLDTANDAIVRDAHGNALGGVRTPQVDVPIATVKDGKIVAERDYADMAGMASQLGLLPGTQQRTSVIGAGKDLWIELETLTNRHHWTGAALLYASDAVYTEPNGRYEGRKESKDTTSRPTRHSQTAGLRPISSSRRGHGRGRVDVAGHSRRTLPPARRL